MEMISIKNLSKNYGTTLALDSVSLNFEQGKIYGLLGRNGAGKSTLLNIISNRIFADSGEVLLNGNAIKENDKNLSDIYMMSESNMFPPKMRVKDILKWTQSFYPNFDLEYAQHLCGLFSVDLKKKNDALSTGYASIVKLIAALSVNTKYVFFDEPVLGLDANYRDLFYRLLLEKYSENPFTAVVSTHLIDEATSIVEHVIIIDKGKILKDESLDEILQNGYTVSGPAADVDAFIANKNVLGVDVLGGFKNAYVYGAKPEQVSENIVIGKMDLQKLFVKLTNGRE